MNRTELRAWAASDGSWGQHANAATHQRYAMPITGRGGRRKCPCGCGRRVTHCGCANGLGMMSGCELHVRRWVRYTSMEVV